MPESGSVESLYPTLATWVRRQGWVEIGLGFRGKFSIRILDEGGMVWEGGHVRQSLDDLLQAAEDALIVWLAEQ